MKPKAAVLPEEMLEDIARRFRALSEPVRLRMLRLLEEGEKSVGEVTEALDATQSNVSRHLQALYEARLVERRRDGTAIYYRIADPMVFKLCDLVCQSARQNLRQRLERLARA